MIYGIERVGIYGGTFSPIHNGHIMAANEFLLQMKLDKVIVIPTNIPPHKSVDISDSPQHRLNMCRLAFEAVDGIEVSDIELQRDGKSYTYDTLKTFVKSNRKLFLLCGTDMMLTFDKWYRYEDIFNLCLPVYIRRENDISQTQKIIAKNNEYYSKHNVAFRRLITEPINISSTEIRNMIKCGKDISEFVPRAVSDYIRSHKLYEN